MRAMSALFTACLAFPGVCAPALAAEIFSPAVSPGGLPFWYLQRKDEPRAIVVGSFLDAFALKYPDKIAAPVVGASIMNRGPKGVSAGEYSEQLKDTQARCGVSNDAMSATFSVETKPEDLAGALDVCFRVVTDPALRDIDFERLRKASKVSRERLETNRNGLASYVMRRLTWAAAPFSRWSEPEEIAKITAADVDLWRREIFARDNLVLVAVGSQEAATFGALIDHSFGALPEMAAAASGVAPSPVYSGKTIVYELAGEQTALVMEGPLAIETQEAQAATIGNNVLGGGMDRRLGRAVRGEQGATYGISSGIGALAPGLRTLSIRSALANDLAIAALARVREEFARWRKDGASEAEVAASRGSLATSFDRSVESPGGKAFTLVQMLRTRRTAEDEAFYIDRLRATDVAEVNRVLREKMPERLTTVIVAPKAEGFAADCVIRAVSEIDRCR